MKTPTPVMLMILDGWGIGDGREANAVAKARTPNLDRLLAAYPNTRLDCSGEAVGLPPGIMGNSEVGHLNIGAGRIVYQDLLRIDKSVADGSFFDNAALNQAMDRAKGSGGAIHLMGLVSDGGVHSQFSHILALVDLAEAKGVGKLYIHAILDGRDTAPDGGAGYLEALQRHLENRGCGTIASVVGRYYAMDRDKRWDRTEKAYRLYTEARGIHETDPVTAVRNAYAKGETDEFVNPVVIVDGDDRPLATLQDKDAVIFFNFRADRARQITRAITDPAFESFSRDTLVRLSDFTCMALYDETFDLPVAFPPIHLERILGEAIAEAGLRQLRIAETEKYAHVTYFFNGGEEKPFAGEDRCLVDSPREVATYDQKPEMSAPKVADEVIRRIQSREYDLIVLNFANMDMVGHTGIMDAAVSAVETVDGCVGRIVGEMKKLNGVILITADHGNAEMMADDDGNVYTAHTTNPVRLILVDDSRMAAPMREGVLGDIAPTILDIMGIAAPEEMTGRSLLA